MAALALALTVLAPHGGAARSAAKRDEARALAAFNDGVKQYRAERFKEAAVHFRAAFEIHPRPVYLFNAGRATQRGAIATRPPWTMSAPFCCQMCQRRS